jgi:hypothetical protein
MRFLALVAVLFAVVRPAGDDPLARHTRADEQSIAWGRVAPGDLVYDLPGLSVVVPPRWDIVHEPMSACIDPVQRIALRRGAAVVQIVESLSGGVKGFPARPEAFSLEGQPQFLACCPPSDGKGWFLPFRDRGRGFYAYVYAGRGGTRAEALRILDSLRVRPRG